MQTVNLDLLCTVPTHNVPVMNKLKLSKVAHWIERNEVFHLVMLLRIQGIYIAR